MPGSSHSLRTGPRQQFRILLAEDRYLLALHYQYLLEELQYVVVGPKSQAKAALAAVRYIRLHGAVLDVELSDGTSFVVARALQTRGVPFFFVSGRSCHILPKDLSAARFLEKPVGDALFRSVAQELFPAPSWGERGSGPAEH
jgi:DNA-binding response OmpR family regulator